VFTLVNLFFYHAWLIHVTFKQIQSRVYMSPCRGWCLSRVFASIHLITVDAGLQLGCCRADAKLLRCWAAARLLCCRAGGTAAKAEGVPKLFSGLVRASFWPRFGLVFGLARNPRSVPYRLVYFQPSNCRSINISTINPSATLYYSYKLQTILAEARLHVCWLRPNFCWLSCFSSTQISLLLTKSKSAC